jgi:hypothetical protein
MGFELKDVLTMPIMVTMEYLNAAKEMKEPKTSGKKYSVKSKK